MAVATGYPGTDLHQPKRRFCDVKRRRHEILRGPHEALARLGLMVQLGQSGRIGIILYLNRLLRLAPRPNFRLELTLQPATAQLALTVLFSLPGLVTDWCR